jgi:hypothetical protein
MSIKWKYLDTLFIYGLVLDMKKALSGPITFAIHPRNIGLLIYYHIEAEFQEEKGMI